MRWFSCRELLRARGLDASAAGGRRSVGARWFTVRPLINRRDGAAPSSGGASRRNHLLATPQIPRYTRAVTAPQPNVQPRTAVPFGEAFRFWVKLGFISFGGPAGQIAIMHRELVDRRRWISEQRFLHALNYCMLLPGPEAQQLAIYI